MSFSLLGRDRELADLTRLLEQRDTTSTVVVIEGDAGIGKTALLEAALALHLNGAEEGDRTPGRPPRANPLVVRAAPTEAEVGFAYAGLGDLFDGIDDLSTVPPVPRAALEQALLRAPTASDATIDVRAVGLATASAWGALAAESGLLIAIDDAHWLDAASMASVEFALRRLAPRGVSVILTCRTGQLPITGERVYVSALADDHIRALIEHSTSATLHAITPRRVRELVHLAAGNPLYAVSLATTAALGDNGRLPQTLRAAIDERLDVLSADLNRSLLYVALSPSPTVALCRAVEILDHIEQAEHSDIVRTSGQRVQFSHPLFAAAVVERATGSEHRAVHRRLHALAAEPLVAIRHAGLGAEEPSADLAQKLSGAAVHMASIGSTDGAADLAALALALTPTDDPLRSDRALDAADLAFKSGDTTAALRFLTAAQRHDNELTRLPTTSATGGDFVADPRFARRHAHISAVVAFSSGEGTTVEWARRLLALSETDAERSEAHALLARVSYDHFPTAAGHAREALRLAIAAELDEAFLAEALVASAGTLFVAGDGLDHDAFRRAMEIETRLAEEGRGPFVTDSAAGGYAANLKLADELDAARDLFLQLLAENHYDGAVPYLLSHLPQLELWAGNWDQAEDYALRHLDAALRTGQQDQAAQARVNLANVSAYRGDTAAAAQLAEELITADPGDLWVVRSGQGLMGLVALSNNDAAGAVEHLAEWFALGEQFGIGEPGYSRMQGDYVEALVATGELVTAEQQSRRMTEIAERLRRRSAQGIAARATALVRAASGDRVAALDAAQRAVDLLAGTPLTFERARAELTLGQVHRRFKEKAAARRHLETALAMFEHLGAERFAERAKQDLARVGVRADHATALTQTERRVAELAALGRTVKQIGEELFISPKTVEANLTRVYRKLGITGRAALATWMANQRP